MHSLKKLLFIILPLALCACSPEAPSVANKDVDKLLPASAMITEDVGNGWVKFQFENHTYLYRARCLGQNGATEVLVKID